VRELCRQLRPLIGRQAEQIHRAFLVEDEVGRAQILDHLELLAAERLHGGSDALDDTLMPIPPSADVAAGPYHLGELTYAGRRLGPFGLRESEWLAHVGIFGRSGAGKTNLGFLVVESLVKAGKPVLIFDWKRNYRDLLGRPDFDNLVVYTVGRGVAPLRFNPLIPPTGTPAKTWLKKIIAVIAHAYLLGDGVLYLLQEALDAVYAAAGVYAGSVQRWPTFRDVLAALRKREVSGREAGWMSSALRALSSLCFGEMDGLLNVGAAPIEDLLQRPVVLELDTLTQSDKVMVVQSMLLWIHHYRMAEGAREVFKHAIVIEEAHHVLSNERRSLVGGQSVMELTFREIREFGESIIILDQQPSSIAPSALANTYATFCFNVKHRADISAIAQTMLLSEDRNEVLSRLPVGEAVVRLQGRGDGPFTIAAPEYPIRKGSVTDAAVVAQLQRLRFAGVLTDVERTDDAPTISDCGSAGEVRVADSGAYGDRPAEVFAPPNNSGEGMEHRIFGDWHGIDALGRAFLRDIHAHPASGVADRYRRLDLSVRQGQKLKDRLIAAGFVAEQISITTRGRIRVIRLTEQGRMHVDAHDQPHDQDSAKREWS
jgi:hypothetical protein